MSVRGAFRDHAVGAQLRQLLRRQAEAAEQLAVVLAQARRGAKEAGGLSGRPLLPLANRMLAETYVRVEEAFPLVGAGGVDSGESALAKIRAGASLIQVYSGLVFGGLGLIAAIKAALLGVLMRDGRPSLSDYVGADAAAITAQPWPR